MICYIKDGEIRMVLLFSFLGSEIKSTIRKRKAWLNVKMDWDNEQIFHWLTAVGLGEYVQRYACTMLHSVIIYEDLYGTSKIDKHTL